MVRAWSIAVPAASLIASGAAPVWASPVTFNSALPVSEDHTIVAVQAIHGDAHDGNAGMRVNELVLMAGYGATPDLAFFVMLPVVNRELDSGATLRRSVSGLGDAQILARYTLFQRDGPGSTLRLAPFVGIGIPTGDHHRADTLGPLPVQLQPGSGGWSPLVGVVGSWNRTGLNFDGQLAWQTTSRVDGVRAGNVLRVDFSAQKRLFSKRGTGGAPETLFGGIELNYSDEASDIVGGVAIPGSASHRLLATPTLQFATIRWVADVGVQIPVTQTFAGTNIGMKQDLTVRLGLRINLE